MPHRHQNVMPERRPARRSTRNGTVRRRLAVPSLDRHQWSTPEPSIGREAAWSRGLCSPLRQMRYFVPLDAVAES